MSVKPHPGGRLAGFFAGRVSFEICCTFCSRVIWAISRSARCSGLSAVFIQGKFGGACALTSTPCTEERPRDTRVIRPTRRRTEDIVLLLDQSHEPRPLVDSG